jgi:hypothetical protein
MPNHQLLCLSRDGSATLLDGQGNVTEDTPIDAGLRRLLHDLLDQGTTTMLLQPCTLGPSILIFFIVVNSNR